MSSFIDLLFPVEQLEALGNKWPEPAPKRRKVEATNLPGRQERQSVPPRRQNSASTVLDQRRHRLSSASQPGKPRPSLAQIHANIGTTKRSNSESSPSTNIGAGLSGQSTTWDAQRTAPAKPSSCLPTFIEPSILNRYLDHLHPNDRPRYSIPDNSPKVDAQTQVCSGRPTNRGPWEYEENASSPASLTTDSASPSSSVDNCPTPSAGIYEQLRSGPFSHLINGLRITEHERDLMEGLLNPGGAPPVMDFFSAVAPSTTKQKAAVHAPELQFESEDYYNLDERLLQNMFAPAKHSTLARSLGLPHTNADREDDVHSSGISPAAGHEEEKEREDGEEEEDDDYKTPAGIVMPSHSILSVDDFFDLDEAASATSPLTL